MPIQQKTPKISFYIALVIYTLYLFLLHPMSGFFGGLVLFPILGLPLGIFFLKILFLVFISWFLTRVLVLKFNIKRWFYFVILFILFLITLYYISGTVVSMSDGPNNVCFSLTDNSFGLVFYPESDTSSVCYDGVPLDKVDSIHFLWYATLSFFHF